MGGCKRAAWRAGTEATAAREEEEEQEEEQEEEVLPHTKRDALAWGAWEDLKLRTFAIVWAAVLRPPMRRECNRTRSACPGPMPAMWTGGQQLVCGRQRIRRIQQQLQCRRPGLARTRYYMVLIAKAMSSGSDLLISLGLI